MKNTLPFLLIAAALLFSQCKKEAAAPCSTFDTDIKPIIEKTCSYSGCHSGATAGAWVPASAKDYTTFAGLKSAIENGKFEDRVLVKANMPNPQFTFNGPKELTQVEKDLIACWLESGHPER